LDQKYLLSTIKEFIKQAFALGLHQQDLEEIEKKKIQNSFWRQNSLFLIFF